MSDEETTPKTDERLLHVATQILSGMAARRDKIDDEALSEALRAAQELIRLVGDVGRLKEKAD